MYRHVAVGYWNTMVRHMMKSFSRFDVPCTCYAGFAESKRQPDLVRVLWYIFPNRTTRGCAAPRRSPQRRWTGTGCLRRVCNSKNDPCTSIRSFIHRYKYEWTCTSCSEWLASVFPPFLAFPYISLFISVDRRSYVHSRTRIILIYADMARGVAKICCKFGGRFRSCEIVLNARIAEMRWWKLKNCDVRKSIANNKINIFFLF